VKSTVPKPSNIPGLFRPEGELAVKELCESLESTRAVLAERAGQAQLETTGLPQDRRSLEFVQAVFKHNFSPSNIEDAIIALKDFQFEVESCQQTTELAFQQVWRVYDIVKSRTLQRRSSVSTISTITPMIPESSTGPQVTTSFRKEIIDWLTRQDVASKSNSATPNIAQIERGTRSGTPNASTSISQPVPITRDQEMSRTARDRMRNIFGLSRAWQDYKKIEPSLIGPPAMSLLSHNYQQKLGTQPPQLLLPPQLLPLHAPKPIAEDPQFTRRRLTPPEAVYLAKQTSRALHGKGVHPHNTPCPLSCCLLPAACCLLLTSSSVAGLATLGIFKPYWHSASQDQQHKLINLFLQSIANSTTLPPSPGPSLEKFEAHLQTASPHDVADVLKWGLRHLQLENQSFPTATSSDEWSWYKVFTEAERAAGFPPNAYTDLLLPLLPPAHKELLSTFLDIGTSVAAHAEANGVSGERGYHHSI